MDFLVDENLPYSISKELSGKGFIAEHVRDLDLDGENDGKIFAKVVDEDAVLITRDLEFGSPEHYPVEDYQGLIVVRLDQGKEPKYVREDIVEFVEKRSDIITGSITVMEEGRYRVRDVEEE